MKARESDRRVILRDAPLPGGVGPTQTHLYMNGTKLMGQMHDNPSVPIIDFSAISAHVPAGSISPFVADIAPEGWGICDGSSYDAFDYRLLHSLISNKFGGSAFQNGVTNVPNSGHTFQIPDFKGKMLMMADPLLTHAAAVGASGGDNERPPLVEHNHGVDASGANIDSDSSIIDMSPSQPSSVALAEEECGVELYEECAAVGSGGHTLQAQWGGQYGHSVYKVTTFGEVGLGGTVTTADEGTPIPPNDTRNLPPYVCINYVIRLV